MTDPTGPTLADTSAWVRYLRPRGSDDLKVAMREAVAREQVATCWVIRTELLVGAKDQNAFDVLLEALRGISDVPITEELWELAARLGYGLRKQGLLVPLPDLLIAQCAISSGRVLWHTDQGFERITEHSSLRTWHWRTAD